MKTFLYLLLSGLIVAEFALCFARVSWLADITCHFILQYTLLAVLTVIGLYFVRAKSWVIIIACFVLLMLALQLGCLFVPRHVTRSGRYEDITILQFNVYMNNRRLVVDQLTSTSPDIIVLQEVTPEIAYNVSILANAYPYQLVAPRKDGFGVAIYSKIPITSKTRNRFESSPNNYSDIGFRTKQGSAFDMIELHAMAPRGKSGSEQRNAELKEIAVVANQQLAQTKILIGDMNITAYSLWFWELERNTRLNNIMQGRTAIGSWPSFAPAPLRIPIDNMLVSDNIEVLAREVQPSNGSDHLPVMTKLRVYATD